MKLKHMEYIEEKVKESVNDWATSVGFYLVEIRNLALGDTVQFGDANVMPKFVKLEIEELYDANDLESSADKIGNKVTENLTEVILKHIEEINVSMKLKHFNQYVKLVLDGEYIIKEDYETKKPHLIFGYGSAAFPKTY